MMFILSSISSGSELRSVNDTSIYENSELKLFKNVNLFRETSSNWTNDLLRTRVYKTLDSCW